jgi:hypothetical protein
MYIVHMGLLYTYRIHELTKFMKKSEKYIHILSILVHLCIKFQRQIPITKE